MMHSVIKKTITGLIAAAAGAFIGFGLTAADSGSLIVKQAAAQNEEGEEKRTRRVHTLTPRVGEKLIEAQEALEAEDLVAAKELIDEAADTRGQNTYDQALINQMYAFWYSTQERYTEAARYFERVLAVADEKVPPGIVEQSMFNLGQLYMIDEQYQKAIDTFNRWLRTNPDAGADVYFFLAQANYQLRRFQETIRNAEIAIAKIEAQGQQVRENYYQILLASYFELENYPKVAEILEILVQLYPKKNYWLQLAAVYSELGRQKDQFYVMKLAHRQGLLTSSSELLNMSQLYAFHQIPYKAAQILCSGLEEGTIENTAQNWEMCGNFLINAEETEESIEPLLRAARAEDDGDIYVRVGQIYMSLGNYSKAAEHFLNALNKGGLRDTGQIWMLRGTALLNEATRFDKRGYDRQAFDAAEAAFNRAARTQKYRQQARQWKLFIAKERERIREEIDLGSRPAG